MRKVDPAGVLNDFKNECNELIDHFDRIDIAIISHPKREGDLSILATQSFLTLFVAFERFCSDLFLAYLNRDFEKYQENLAIRFNQSVESKFGLGVVGLSSLKRKKHFSIDEIEQIVDLTGYNLTFITFSKLKEESKNSLSQNFSNRICSVTNHEERLVDTAHAIRDFIAHQSIAAKKRMNEKLSTIEAATHNKHLGRTGNVVHNIGAYLKASPNGTRRLHKFANSLLAIATKM